MTVTEILLSAAIPVVGGLTANILYDLIRYYIFDKMKDKDNNES